MVWIGARHCPITTARMCEVQAGLFRNQETYAFLQPRQSIRFSEYWMPVREIGGISRANLNGIVHLSRQGNALLIGLNVNHALEHASLRVLDGKQQVLQENADLSPERVWSHQLALANPQDKYTFELQDDHGAVLLHQTEGEYDWTPAAEIHAGPQTSYIMPPAEKRSEDDWIQLGNQQELDGQLLPALATYQQALAKYPDSFGLQKAAGRLCAGLLRYAEAKKYLEAVHARDTSDAEASYYLGIAYDALGETRAARGAFEAAHLMPEFKAAGDLRLGELSARSGELNQAESYLQEALQDAPDDLRTAEELAAVRRVLAKPSGTGFRPGMAGALSAELFLAGAVGAGLESPGRRFGSGAECGRALHAPGDVPAGAGSTLAKLSCRRAR